MAKAIKFHFTLCTLKVIRKHNDGEFEQQTESKISDSNLYYRSNRTLDAIRARAWREKWHC